MHLHRQRDNTTGYLRGKPRHAKPQEYTDSEQDLYRREVQEGET